MLVILWFMVLCFTVGAHDQLEMTDEVEVVPDDLDSDLNDETYVPHISKILSSKWYPWEPSTSYPEEHWSPTTEYIAVDPSEGQPDEYEDNDGYTKEPPENDYEHEYPVQVGSIRGIPGINFPDYKDIPLTNFHCSDKVYVPGFYADMETGCQVFHVCWPHRRESFLCPIGTIFNQAILACDYWYSSNCSLASHYYDVNSVSPHADTENKRASLGSMIDSLLEVGKSDSMLVSSEGHSDGVSKENFDLSEIFKFLPVKAKVVVYPEAAGSPPKIIAEASMGKTKKSKVVKQVRQKPQIHEVEPKFIGVRQKVAVFPHRPHVKVAPVQKVVPVKAKHSYREIDRIVDGVFAIVKNILKESRDLHPVIDKSLQKSDQEHKYRKHSPLTKLNPRFIINPAKVPKRQKRSVQSTTETPEVQKPRVLSKAQAFPSKKHIVPDLVSGSRHTKLSPSTKKTLTDSYLKLIKIRSR